MKDSRGNIISEEKLKEVCKVLAYRYRKNAIDIYKENAYALHVTENEKLDNVTNQFVYAEHVENCDFVTIMSSKLWQDVNQRITGDCVALLPK